MDCRRVFLRKRKNKESVFQKINRKYSGSISIVLYEPVMVPHCRRLTVDLLSVYRRSAVGRLSGDRRSTVGNWFGRKRGRGMNND